MFEHMGKRKKDSLFSLLATLSVAVVVGLLISNFVLSLDPIAGFGVIFAVSAVIIVVAGFFGSTRRRSDRRGLFFFKRSHDPSDGSAGTGPRHDETLEAEAELVDSASFH